MVGEKKPGNIDRSATIQAKLNDIYEARRKFPRVVVDRPLYIDQQAGEPLRATVHDVSPDGLKIYCDRETAKAIHPSGKYINPGKGPILRVRFALPFQKGLHDVTAVCQTRYIEAIPDHDIAFGLEFAELEGDSAEVISRHIAEAMRPVEDKLQAFLENPHSRKEISTHMKMAPRETAEALNRLKIKGDVIAYGPGSEPTHMKLSATIQVALDKIEKLEQRVSSLEKKLAEK